MHGGGSQRILRGGNASAEHSLPARAEILPEALVAFNLRQLGIPEETCICLTKYQKRYTSIPIANTVDGRFRVAAKLAGVVGAMAHVSVATTRTKEKE